MRFLNTISQIITLALFSNMALAAETVSIKPDDEYTLASSFAIASHRIAVEVVQDCQGLNKDLNELAPWVMGRWNEKNKDWIKVATDYRIAAKRYVEDRHGRRNAQDYFAVGDAPWFDFIKSEKRRLLAHGDRAEMCSATFIRLNKGEFDITANAGYHSSLVVMKELLQGK